MGFNSGFKGLTSRVFVKFYIQCVHILYPTTPLAAAFHFTANTAPLRATSTQAALPELLRLASLHLSRYSYHCTVHCVISSFAVSSWTD